MVEHIEKPHLVTKPIQLLAAWLVGLSAVDASFLGAAKLIGTDHWECGALVVASIFNVPGFIYALFLLQTKFRPEMQEDTFYSQYISSKTGQSLQINKFEFIEKQIEELKAQSGPKKIDRIARGIANAPSISVNDNLPFYAELRSALKNGDIDITSLFGKFNNAVGIPKKWVVTFSEKLEPNQIIPVLRVCCEFPFEGYSGISRILDIEEEEVYLGSYVFPEKIIRFTDEVRLELKESADDSKLGYLLKIDDDLE